MSSPIVQARPLIFIDPNGEGFVTQIDGVDYAFTNWANSVLC